MSGQLNTIQDAREEGTSFKKTATMENNMVVSQKIKIALHCDPTIPLLVIYLEKNKNTDLKDTCAAKFTAALFTIAT